MTTRLLVGLFLLILGGFCVVRADLMLRLQIWTNRVVMGAQYIPSRRTLMIVRGLGVFFVLMGLSIIVFARF